MSKAAAAVSSISSAGKAGESLPNLGPARSLSSQEPSHIGYEMEGETSLIMTGPVAEVTREDNILKRANKNVTALDMVMFMPSVTTQGDNPNGKFIEGFLASYTDIGNIKIVCNCHGKMMSPSDFIKHASETDLDNPMKYIKVLPTKLDNKSNKY